MPKKWLYSAEQRDMCTLRQAYKTIMWRVWVENVAMSELEWWNTGPCSRSASHQKNPFKQTNINACSGIQWTNGKNARMCAYCHHSEKSVHNNLLWAFFVCVRLFFFNNFQFHTVESSRLVERMLITFYTALIWCGYGPVLDQFVSFCFERQWYSAVTKEQKLSNS